MHPLGRKRDLFDAISCFVRGYNYMAPFVFEEYVISDNAVLTIIDIENIDEATKAALDANFVLICEGNSGSSLSTVKMRVRNLFSSKNPEWIMGATAEFFVHLYIRLAGFRQECLFLNLEENSIKKGFDGYYVKESFQPRPSVIQTNSTPNVFADSSAIILYEREVSFNFEPLLA